MSSSAPHRGERTADAGVLPALVAVRVEFVDGLIAVAGDQCVAVGKADGAVRIVDVSLPEDFARRIDFLHLADASEGDEIAAAAQAFDAAPGESGADLGLEDHLSLLIDFADFAAGVDPDVMAIGELASVIRVPLRGVGEDGL